MTLASTPFPISCSLITMKLNAMYSELKMFMVNELKMNEHRLTNTVLIFSSLFTKYGSFDITWIGG